MTADFYPFDMRSWGRVATRIINEVKGINRVTYDITSKPPGTIEWDEAPSALGRSDVAICENKRMPGSKDPASCAKVQAAPGAPKGAPDRGSAYALARAGSVSLGPPVRQRE
jgi:hypothetical protein